MKNGKSLVELAQELERQSQAKKDFVASTETMEMTPGGQLILDNSSSDNTYDFSLTEVAHTQISQRLNIPLKYYKRMREDAPELLAQNGVFCTTPQKGIGSIVCIETFMFQQRGICANC